MPRTEIHNKGIKWVDIVEPNQEELNELGKEFHFHPHDIEDCKKKGQRQKVERYHDYAFLVFLVPVYNRATREIEPGEVDVFIGKDYLVTVQDKALPQIQSLRAQFKNDPEVQERVGESSTSLLQELLDRLIVSLYPMLDHISLDIHRAEKVIFAGREKRMVAEIALLRRNITDFRRIVQTHKNTLKRLVEVLTLQRFEGVNSLVTAFELTIDRTKEIWDLLESFRESIETVYETNESLISYRLNEIMRAFTTISVIIFFMTLITALFSVRARGTPLIDFPFAFWLLLLLVAFSGLVAHQFFKKRRLLE